MDRQTDGQDVKKELCLQEIWMDRQTYGQDVKKEL